MSYKLKIGSGAAVTFQSLGIQNATFEEDVEGRSFLTLETRATLSSSGIIAPFQAVTLLDSSDTVRFKGWLDEAPRRASGESQSISYRLTGPHRWLARANFVQQRGGLVVLGGMAGSQQSAPQSFSQAVADVAASALEAFPNAFALTGQSVFSHQIPVRLRSDVDCLTSLLSLISFAPSAVLWWSYDSNGFPTLNVGNGLGSAQKSLSTATHLISQTQLNPRYDLLADRVTVYYISRNVVAGSESSASAGDAASLGANRKLIFSYETTVLNNLPSAGIASALAAWHQTLHIDGTATMQQIDWSDRPGIIYGFAGADLSHFASYTTLLHTLARNLFTGESVLKFGVLPGKTLFKVADLDNGAGPTPGTHSGWVSLSSETAARVNDLVDNLSSSSGPLTPQDISGLSGIVDALNGTEEAEGLLEAFNSLKERVDGLDEQLNGMNSIPDQISAIQGAFGALTLNVTKTTLVSCGGTQLAVVTDAAIQQS